MKPKDIIPNLNKPVTYKGVTHTLVASVVRKNEQGNLYYQAVIKDTKANSVSYVKLEGIE